MVVLVAVIYGHGSWMLKTPPVEVCNASGEIELWKKEALESLYRKSRLLVSYPLRTGHSVNPNLGSRRPRGASAGG